MVPHGELKLIICDNLSASENSNMSTKLCEPQKGVGREKKNDKRKGEGKEKGAVRYIIFARKKHLLVGRAVTVFDCDLTSLIAMYSAVIQFFRSEVYFVFGVR